MKLIIKREALEDAIKKVGGVLGQMPKKDAAVVVMQAVVGKRGEEVFKGLTITMSNGHSQVTTNIFCELSSEIADIASFSVGGELVGAVNALAGVKGEFYSICEYEGSVVVSMGDSSITLAKKVEGVMPVALDVKNPECKILGKVVLDAKAFKDTASRVLFAAMADDDKAIGGVGLVARENSIIFRATDSFRLAESNTEATIETDFDCVVSPAVLKLVVSTVGGDKVVLIKTDKHLSVQAGTDMWQVSLLDKKYPHTIFEDISKMEIPCRVTVDRAELLVALDIVEVAVSKTDSVVTFELEGDKLVAFGDGRTAKATFAYELEGELPASISFASRLFKQCLNAFKGEKITFTLATKKVSKFSSEGENVSVCLSPVAR